ncbi:hypothetical protein RJ640_025263 [Escallonia rubra]|uniref:Bis(5'-adenosyl)-triphosphatase n=1 Tax=Escallonia rubra TaxID=112253 RepID=A0AA88UM76_9ASTE|nr:hypothetical protein RJ640_025263 [Escallonia rubra]
MDLEKFKFGPYKIDPKEVFYHTDLSYAMVNLRPLLPGKLLSLCSICQKHKALLGMNNFNAKKIVGLAKIFYRKFGVKISDKLIFGRREVKRFVDLTTDETSDLWITAKKVGSRLEHHHKASSLTFAIQDGPEAGQTVPHVHIHIIPRRSGDFENNDEIYDAIDLKEKELKQKLDLDKERKDRSLEEMVREADEYRNLFS